MRAAVTILTWNLQGSQDVDVPAISGIIRAVGPDVVALQEVQRRQASRLSSALDMPVARWGLKHWPIVHPAEGLAVLTPHRVVDTDLFSIRRRPLWDYRRRVGLDVSIDMGDAVVRVLDVHLSAHGETARRVNEARLLARRSRSKDRPAHVVGDLNEHPHEGAHATLVQEGWIDAWSVVNGDVDGGWTNWTGGDRRGRPATQRLDYVLAPHGAVVERSWVITDAPGVAEMADLSDHLPLVATVRESDVREDA